jgi:hypothetical protein
MPMSCIPLWSGAGEGLFCLATSRGRPRPLCAPGISASTSQSVEILAGHDRGVETVPGGQSCADS